LFLAQTMRDNRTMNFRILLLTFIMVMTGCNESGSKGALEEAFETDPPASGNVVNGTCYQDQYSTPEEVITRKLDIAIVIDTSGSIKAERADIAMGFDHLINQLPAEVDYQIAVFVGHGEKNGRSGVLYKKGSEPLILSSELHSVSDIQNHLKTKMNNPHTDGETDGGELGMYSLYKAVTDNLGDNQTDGFFRDDAALSVIFVADEQDICAEFPEGVIPVPDPQGKEDSAKPKYCEDEAGNLIITPQIVLDELKALKGDYPLVVGGVLYNNSATIPLGGENEIGYGYKETIELSGGIIVDMANGDYGTGLENLGKLATVSIQPANDFNLQSSKVDPATIEVLVDNQPVAFSYNAELNQVHLTNPRDAFSVARVSYCDKEEKPMEVIKLAAGGFHTCALLLDGQVKCWGKNNVGQLGLGHTDNIGDNELISDIDPIDLGGKAIEISAGMQHTCAILENGDVKCWGENLRGQLGQGHTDNLGDNESIADIPAISLGAAAKKIYSGTRYNCALLANKKVKCWGENNFGQLGLGHKNNMGDDEDISSVPNVNIGGDVVSMDISTISFHTCAVLVSGDMKCWGLNNFGQLGYGHKDMIGDDETPADVGAVPFGSQILQLATGFQHTCALAGGQEIRCWGANSKGQIGTGNSDTIGDDEAADSIGFLNTGASGHLMVATGNFHTCAVGSDYNVYCFGQGNNGVLGLGNTNNLGDNESITNVSKVNLGDLQISQIAAGTYHTCALTKDEGKVICWGQGDSGQLGYGNTNSMGDDENPSGLLSILAAE
jgi:alpha-tubulin suppressor-like RCC1 family protein